MMAILEAAPELVDRTTPIEEHIGLARLAHTSIRKLTRSDCFRLFQRGIWHWLSSIISA